MTAVTRSKAEILSIDDEVCLKYLRFLLSGKGFWEEPLREPLGVVPFTERGCLSSTEPMLDKGILGSF